MLGSLASHLQCIMKHQITSFCSRSSLISSSLVVKSLDSILTIAQSSSFVIITVSFDMTVNGCYIHTHILWPIRQFVNDITKVYLLETVNTVSQRTNTIVPSAQCQPLQGFHVFINTLLHVKNNSSLQHAYNKYRLYILISDSLLLFF